MKFLFCPQKSLALKLQHSIHNTRTIIIRLFLPWINDTTPDTSRLKFKTIVSRLDIKRTCIIYIIRVYIYIHIVVLRIPSQNTLKRNINSNCCVDDDTDVAKNNYVDITSCATVHNNNNNNNDNENDTAAFTNSSHSQVSPADVFGGHVLKILNVSRSHRCRYVEFASNANTREWIIHITTTNFGFWF